MITFSTDLVRFSAAAIDAAYVSAREAGDLALAAAAAELHEQIRTNMSYTDHPELVGRSRALVRRKGVRTKSARLDHPYARRYGRIQIHGDGQRVIHKRTGRLLSALRLGRLPSQIEGEENWTIWLDADAVDYAYAVIRGTKKMLGRDLLWETAIDPRVQRQLMRTIVRVYGKELRTKATLRFVRMGGASSAAMAAK
jgi:hypothetical protein